MSLESTYAAVLNRLAVATSVRRVRREDSERLVRHDGTRADLTVRLEAAVEKLEKLVERLEV